MSFTLEACYATLPRTTRGQHIVIGGDPKGKNFLYTNGNSIIIRNIEDPSIADVYTQHSCQTTVAKYSPSGFYIASGDTSGKVRIWDTVNKEHILKNEFTPFAGKVCDLAWSSDNQRIVAVGEGKEKFGHVFNADTGTSTGEIRGMTKPINACDFKPTRPFRIATASEDMSVSFFKGPPFKYESNFTEHTRFVNAIKYAPDGSVFISGGADGKAFVFDGASGEKIGELGPPAHKGGIYGLSFSPDSKEVLTVSGDKTCKIFNVETKQCVVEFPMGTRIEDMQVGCLWQGDYLISVSLSGHINYLDRNNPSQPSRIVKGHSKPITALALTEDHSIAFTGASDGQIIKWNINNGQCEEMKGKGHNNQIQDLQIQDDVITSVSMDDTIRMTPVTSAEYNSNSSSLESQPRKVSVASGGLSVVACVNHLSVLRNGNKVFSLKVDFEPLCVAINPGLTEVVAGGAFDQNIHVYSLNGDTLSETQTIAMTGSVQDLKFSPNGQYLASADSNRKVSLFEMPGYKSKPTMWGYHTAKVNTIAWTPDGTKLGSGSLDTNLEIWNTEQLNKHITIRGAHPQNQITRVAWLDGNTLISVGQDSCIRKWKITHH